MRTVFLTVFFISACIAAATTEEIEAPNWPVCGPDSKGKILGDNACFYYENQMVTNWTSAEFACRTNGGHLASFASKQETEQFVKWVRNILLFEDRAWIGLHTVGLDGAYEWVDGKLVDYTNWRTTRKIYGDTGCVYIEADGKWDVTECKNPYGAVCKIFTGPTTTEGPATNATESPPAYCPTGWISFGEKCYRLVNQKTSWKDANHACQVIGQGLVSIHSTEEQAFLTSLLGRLNISVWIGLNRTATVELYKWSDQSEIDFTNWAPRQPNDQKLCVEMLGDPRQAGKWNDTVCQQNQGYICQTERDPAINSTTPSPSDNCTFQNATFYEYRNSCYNIFSANGTTWRKAEMECNTFGGHLVSIMDAQETAFIGLLREDDEDLWIGLSAEATTELPITAQFEWIDKWPMVISVWGRDQPVIAYEQKKGCVVMTADDKWAVRDCDEARGFVCKVTTEKPPLVPVPGPEDKCPPPSDVTWQNVGNSHCYYINYDSLRTWSQAAEVCSQLDPAARLASLHSRKEVANLFNKTRPFHSFWIGLARGREGGFQWNDNSAVNFISWTSKTFKQNGSDCVVLTDPDMSWTNTRCDDRRGFICMIDKEEVKTPTESTTVTLYPRMCQKGWQYFEDNCYNFYSDWTKVYNWSEAGKFCMKQDSQLASVHSEDENDFIHKQLKLDDEDFFRDSNYWLGMYRPARSESYLWSDGSTQDFTKLPKPHSHGPFNEQHCVSINKLPGVWNDTLCSNHYGIICKRPYNETYVTTAMPTTTTLAPGNCEDGWKRLGNKCIKIFDDQDDSVNWNEALVKCRKNYDDLLSIHSTHEQMVITSLLGLQNYTGAVWIGLRRTGVELFGWADISDYDYSYWGAGQPSGQMENCTALETNKVRAGKWRNTMCNESRGYICQNFPNQEVITSSPEYDNKTDEGFVKYGMSDYKFELNVTKAGSWQEAEDNCMKYGGHLASINSPYEQAFIYSQLDSVMDVDSLWIGLADLQENGVFRWSDNWPIFYTDWAADEPQHPDHMTRCVYLDVKTQEWKSGDCRKQMSYICKVTDEKPPFVPSWNNKTCSELDPMYKDWVDIGNNYCYYISSRVNDTKLSWIKAADKCSMQGAKLASIHSHKELDLLVPYFQDATSPVWIGLMRRFHGGFGWLDGTALNFVHWQSSYPTDYKEDDCVAINQYNIGWMDKNCERDYGFICKVEKYEPLPTTVFTTDITSNDTSATGNGTETTTQNTTGTGTVPSESTTGSDSTAGTSGTSPPHDTTGLAGGAIAGIVIGCLAAVAVVAGVAFYMMRRRRDGASQPLITDLSSP